MIGISGVRAMKKARRVIRRSQIFPESSLPDVDELVTRGRDRAKRVQIGASPFLSEKNVSSEVQYKRRCMKKGVIMLHAQIGYRDREKTRRAYREVYDKTVRAGHGVDRFGICLDWSMGYPSSSRGDMPRGTGLILETTDQFIELTQEAPAAPHFGDFVLGMPAAVANTEAALAAGSTSIGNLGQYFNFRLPYWTDDVATTAATVEAIALAAAQPVEVLIHSNLDDGFAAQFHDVACALGAVLIERYIVEELMGGCVGHCYGHTYSEPMTRLAFQRALASVSRYPGTMVYGNTTVYGPEPVENFANLAGYLLVDVAAQRSRPSGHAVNPVPVTEALRIPEIGEIIDAHLFCIRLIARTGDLKALFDWHEAEQLARKIAKGGKKFKKSVLSALAEGGVDTGNPFEVFLALRRIGAKRLEAYYGPGKRSKKRGVRVPVVKASTLADLEAMAEHHLSSLDERRVGAIRRAHLKGCLATTDVHEYGKLLVEAVLRGMDIAIIDGGVSTDPGDVAEIARENGVDFVAVSTYSGVALDYLQRLRREMEDLDLEIPIFVGGKLNQILDHTASSMPVDVAGELEETGAIACRRVEDMFEPLTELAREKSP
jgi:methylmalonyl-CoA mutase cobalamin-binding subunit